MKPTALTEAILSRKNRLIELLQHKDRQSNLGNKDRVADVEIAIDEIEDTIGILQSLLPKERQDMEEAYKTGRTEKSNVAKSSFGAFLQGWQGEDGLAKSYFNQNFTQDITNQ